MAIHGNVSLKVEFEYEKYAQSQPTTITVCLHLESHLQHGDSGRQLSDEEILDLQSTFPTHKIVFVLDTSDSMEHVIDLLKQIMNKVIDSTHGDDIGIVSFATDPSIISPLVTITTPQERANMKNAIRSMKTNGCTNLCAGLLEGLNVLWNQPPVNTMDKRFLIVLTDGVTNAGVVHVDDIQHRLGTFPYICQTDIYCMALGEHVNQDLLQSIVVSHNGRLYAVRHSADLPQSFGDCMGSIMSTLISDLTIVVSSPFEMSTGYNSIARASDFTLTLEVGTMFVNDVRDILVSFKIPDVPELLKGYPISGLDMNYTDVFTRTIRRTTMEINPIFDDIPISVNLNPAVRLQQIRIEVSNYIIQRGQVKNYLDRLMEEVKHNGWENDPVAKELSAIINQLPSMSPMLLRGLSVGLSSQRQTTSIPTHEAIYTTVLQRSVSKQFSDLDELEDVAELPTYIPRYTKQERK